MYSSKMLIYVHIDSKRNVTLVQSLKLNTTYQPTSTGLDHALVVANASSRPVEVGRYIIGGCQCVI